MAGVAQLVGAWSCTPKSCGFSSLSGHVSGAQVQSQLGHMQEATDQSLSLSLSLPLPLSEIKKCPLVRKKRSQPQESPLWLCLQQVQNPRIGTSPRAAFKTHPSTDCHTTSHGAN